MKTVARTLVLLLSTGACGAESWSFDADSGGEDADAAILHDAAASEDASDEAAVPLLDAPVESGFVPESEPPAEAAPRCSADAGCPSDAPLCSPSGSCVRCSGDLDCAGAAGGSVCNLSTGGCVQCTSDSNCSPTAMLPYCDTATDLCVGCLTDAQCGRESFCQLASHTCSRMF